MREPQTERPVSTLLRELSTEARELVRQEIELAKSELIEKVKTVRAAAVRSPSAWACCSPAGLPCFTAVNRGLTAGFAQLLPVAIAIWLAPLVLGLITAMVGGVLVRAGMEKLRQQELVPRQTAASMKENKEWIEEKIH